MLTPYGVTPINGGLFLGDDPQELVSARTQSFPNDHDQRNEAQFQLSYNHHRSGLYVIFNGRYDSGVPTDVATWNNCVLQFVAEGFDPRLYDEIDFQRGRVKPRTLLGPVSGG